DFKEDDIALAKWYQHILEKQNVEIHYETTVTKDMVLNENYDAIIIATGSVPKVFNLGQLDKTFTAEQVLAEEHDLGEHITVIGGGLVGCETALYLSQNGKKVTIVEALDKLLAINGPLCHANSDMLEKLIPFNHIDVMTNVQAREFKGNTLTLSNGQSIQTDSVVLAVGYQEENRLYQELQFEIPEIYVLGDAKNVANIMYGIWDAFEVANHID
ncbi:NAD(P)/FAD-dependent oxidoreductase, partial [Thomasclavelia sp.]|uniref:NAD(P)/FAD-dependent oxidoreductase n=1 Tax=Thomasclavelia sp. TaxID=3025757 RepID=UPI0025FF78E4